MTETILIVDDEEPVRRTLREWLEGGELDCTILVAADAEEALVLANRLADQPDSAIDLAVLDWNLGAGTDGLRLLEDLVVFHPDIVAILITGYAHQATPLDAMRMGVRDYLDKNHEFDRAGFLASVRRQLDRIRPAKRERHLAQRLAAFRAAVEKVIPLVRSTAALTDPTSLTRSVGGLFRFLLQSTGARDGVLLVHGSADEGEAPPASRAYDADGRPIEGPLVPLGRSLAGSALGMQEPCALTDLDGSVASGTIDLQPFERGRASALIVPLDVLPGVHVILELFDRPGGFTAADRQLVRSASDLGGELLRHAVGDRRTQRLLWDALEAALGATASVQETLGTTVDADRAAPAAVLDQLREGLTRSPSGAAAGETVRLAEAIRLLAERHGPLALNHCLAMIEDLRRLLDRLTGTENG